MKANKNPRELTNQKLKMNHGSTNFENNDRMQDSKAAAFPTNRDESNSEDDDGGTSE